MNLLDTARACLDRHAARSLALLGATGLALLAATGPAAASEFTINACQADRAHFSTQAFEDFATRGMLWKRACDPEGPGLRGLVTANVVRRGRVARGARSYFVLRAPSGTRFAQFTWSGQARRRDCRYALQLWADRPDATPVPIKNVRANKRCPRHRRAQAAGWPRPRTYNVAGATRIVQRVICVGSSKAPYCSSNGLNYIRTFKAQATVVDLTPPTVSIVQDNPFTRGAWVSGVQSVSYAAADNVGVGRLRPMLNGAPYGDTSRSCDFARRVPCPNGPGAIGLDTDKLREGSQTLVLRALDAAGNPGDSPPVPVRVDNTAPGAVAVTLEGGEGWRNRNDFHVAWTNPGEPDRAPIAAAHFRLCRTNTLECSLGVRASPGINQIAGLVVPGPGQWQFRLWREDAATNQEPANASVPVTLRFDPEPPQLGFEPTSALDPTRVSVLVTDKTSGLARGQIELSREGSAIWQALPTQLDGSRLVARIDDAHLPAGPYLLRATAQDRATNQSSTDRRLDGSAMAINLPLRITTAMRAGVVRKRTVRRAVGRRRNRHRVRRRGAALRPRAHVGFAERVRIRGSLATRAGRPIAGAEVQVFSGSEISPEQLVDAVQTDERGRYDYVARAGSSRTLRFAYAGTPSMLPSEREVTLLVPAASTIRATPRKVLNGKAVRFTGRLRSLPPPSAGKLVELQVVLSGHWQTFRTLRTSSAGAWHVRYRFRRSCGLVRYRFRARLPAETGYPFATGRTRPIGVRVRGGRCP